MKTKKTKKKTTGDFTSKIKFIEFVGGKGFVNFISNEATIEGKYLSGLHYNDLVFKLKIYDDGTVDLDEVDTNQTTPDERKRLLDIIEEQTLTPYRNRTVVNELQFTSIEKLKDKHVPLYLAIDYAKPIEKLTSLFDDSPDISEDAMNNLDSLINSWFDEEDFVEEIEYTTEDPSGLDIYESSKRMNDYMSSLEDSFTKMREEKLEELKDKREKIEKEINKLEFQLSTTQKSLEENKSELKLVESRIDDIQPLDEPNGFYFFVSERCNEVITFEPEIEKVIREKVSTVKSINLDNFMKLFTTGEYHIKIAKVKDDSFETVTDFETLSDEIIEKLSKLGIISEEDNLTYRGEMVWGEIVNKMIKNGFLQSPEFDKHCGSNSYVSQDLDKKNIKNIKAEF
jgi:hypothetical protein